MLGKGIGAGNWSGLRAPIIQPPVDIVAARGYGQYPVVPLTRASTATYVDVDGVLKTSAVNEPRFDWTGGERALLLEAAATNLLNTQTFVSHSGTGLNRDSVTVSGVFPAVCTFSPLTGTVPHYAYLDPTSLSVTAGVTYAISVWIGTPAPFAFVSGGSTGFGTNQWLVINTATGEIVHAQNCTGRTAAFDGGWQVTMLVAATITASQVSVATGTSNGSNVRLPWFVSADPFIVFGAQVEASDTPTSYIPTNGTAVTRAADIAAPIDLSGFDLSGGYTALITGRLDGVSGPFDRLVQLDGGDSSSRHNCLYNKSSTRFRSEVLAGNAFQATDSGTPIAPLPSDFSCAWSVGSNLYDFALDGVARGHDETVSYIAPLRASLGNDGSSGGISRRLRLTQFTLYPYVMSAAELAAMTAIAG